LLTSLVTSAATAAGVEDDVRRLGLSTSLVTSAATAVGGLRGGVDVGEGAEKP